MAVYFLRAPTVGAVKVGVSVSPKNRLNSVSAWSPVPLEIVAVDPRGDLLTESEILWRFRSARTRGEWMHETAKVSAFLDEMASTQSVPGGWYYPEGYATRIKRHSPHGAPFADIHARFGIDANKIREVLGFPKMEVLPSLAWGISVQRLPALYDYLRGIGYQLHYHDLLDQRFVQAEAQQ